MEYTFRGIGPREGKNKGRTKGQNIAHKIREREEYEEKRAKSEDFKFSRELEIEKQMKNLLVRHQIQLDRLNNNPDTSPTNWADISEREELEGKITQITDRIEKKSFELRHLDKYTAIDIVRRERDSIRDMIDEGRLSDKDKRKLDAKLRRLIEELKELYARKESKSTETFMIQVHEMVTSCENMKQTLAVTVEPEPPKTTAPAQSPSAKKKSSKASK